MLTIKLTHIELCSSIPALLKDIDCKLVEMSNLLYNNIAFAIRKPVDYTVYMDLLNYKRILTWKLSNEDYASPFTVEMIASKVKLLIYK